MNKKSIPLLLCLLGVAGLYWFAQAGDMEPPGPPGPTMKTLNDMLPAWSQRIVSNDGVDVCSSSRFQCVLFDTAVLDRETGLVWQKAPSTDTMDWYAALNHCYSVGDGGRRGWRLPAQAELASLADPGQSNPALPPGHPFQGIQEWRYWSANTFAQHNIDPVHAWLVDFEGGSSGWFHPKQDLYYAWCVRGGSGIDGQFPHP